MDVEGSPFDELPDDLVWRILSEAMRVTWTRTPRLRAWGPEEASAFEASTFARLSLACARFRDLLAEHGVRRHLAIPNASDWDLRALARHAPELDELSLPGACISVEGGRLLRGLNARALELSYGLEHLAKLQIDPLPDGFPPELRRLAVGVPEEALYRRREALARAAGPLAAGIAGLARLESLALHCLPLLPAALGHLRPLAPRLADLTLTLLVHGHAAATTTALPALAPFTALRRLALGFAGLPGVPTEARPAVGPAELEALLRPLAPALEALALGAPVLDAAPLARLAALRELDLELAPGASAAPLAALGPSLRSLALVQPPQPREGGPGPAAAAAPPLHLLTALEELRLRLPAGALRALAAEGGRLRALRRLRAVELEAHGDSRLPRRLVAALAPLAPRLRLRSPCRLFAPGAPRAALQPLAGLARLELAAGRGAPWTAAQRRDISGALPAVDLRFR